MRTHYPVHLLLCILLVSLAVGCGRKDPVTEAEAAAGSEEASPDVDDSSSGPVTFEAQALDGSTLSSDLFSDSRITMVNVWATYCNPCLREMPGLGELAAEYDQSEFQIIGIVSDVWEGEDQTLVESLVQETGAAYPHLLANDSVGQAILSSVSAVPTTFFFDGDGAYLGGVVGSREKSDWEELIHELLEKQ